MIDLRSDTVTQPSEAMRKAMATAKVGDDVLGEDPTVNQLQERIASLLGKEAGLFMPSGTMANQVAIKTHIQPGNEIIIDKNAHIFYYECGAAAVISGGQFHCLGGEKGILTAKIVEAAIRPADIHQPPTRLICLENSHNRGGGSIYTLENLAGIAKLAAKHDIRVHLDGARLFNAALAAKTTVQKLARQTDSVCVAFSKGLGAPAGSVLCGSKELIEKAIRFRKMLGGGMRQVGILAAACLYALDNNVKRLEVDHQNAKRLALGLAGMEGLKIDPEQVVTNIVLFDVGSIPMDAYTFAQRLAPAGVLLIPFGPSTLRAVTHLDVTTAEIDKTLEIIQQFLKKV